MAEDQIYGVARIAEYLEISESTVRRWRQLPEARFIAVDSMSNAGGGYGRGAWSMPSSLSAFKTFMREKISEVRREAAWSRWRGSDQSSGSNVNHNSTSGSA